MTKSLFAKGSLKEGEEEHKRCGDESLTSVPPGDPNIDSDLYPVLLKLWICDSKQDAICFALAEHKVILQRIPRLQDDTIGSLSYREAGTNDVICAYGQHNRSNVKFKSS